jgi:tetratricopeptide (TPR) repeat protein
MADKPAPPEPPESPTPREAPAWNGEAQRLAKLGQWEDAIACYEKALAEEQIGRTQDALQSFERYIAAAPAQDREQIEYAVRRHRELASRQEDNTAPPAPSEPEPSTPMHHDPPQAQPAGVGADQKGDQGPDEPIASRDQALDDGQQDAAALYGKGLSMAGLGRLEDAVDCYKQALALDPGLVAAWFSKARAEERVGQVREAVRSYERFIALATCHDERRIKHARWRLRKLKR